MVGQPQINTAFRTHKSALQWSLPRPLMESAWSLLIVHPRSSDPAGYHSSAATQYPRRTPV